MNLREAENLVPLPGQRVAVIGGGIAGLASAWLLRERYHVTLFEADAELGGHTHTVDVALDGVEAPVDTGFLVFNRQTYPHLCALFEHVGVGSAASEMSFAVSLKSPDVEWAGTSLATLFGQPENLRRPAFLRMVADIVRFNREAKAYTLHSDDTDVTLGDFLDERGYSQTFRQWYLLPMAAAIWSCPTRSMLAYPLRTFVRFCHNHGLLQIFDRPQWLTVRGGGRSYVRRLGADLADVRLAAPVRAVLRQPHATQVVTDAGTESFDAVVFACHSDQARRILGNQATRAEAAILEAVRYQPNVAWLHTDRQLLPRRERVWAAWNYMAGEGVAGDAPVSVTYLINRLQPLPFAQPVMVSLNPAEPPREEHVIKRIEYAHPVFDRLAVEAQSWLPAAQGQARCWFAGAWTGYGFHEDGLRSAVEVAKAFGATIPWEPAAAREAVAA